MADNRNDRRGLKRGLSALMEGMAPDVPELTVATDGASPQTIGTDQLQPNPNQPRRDFDADALRELADSIRQHGVIQPIVVSPSGVEGRFTIVAGERRWRAAQMAQLHRVPVVVRSYSDDDILQIALLENIQRQDLNAIEEAAAYKQLMDRFGHTQEQLSAALGKSRSHIANTLRLLALPPAVQALLRDNRLTAGHARALLMVPNPEVMAQRVIAEGLSVRQVEAAAKDVRPANLRKPPEGRDGKDADTRALEDELSAALQLAVSINHAPNLGGGTVSVRYRTLGDLDMLCAALAVARDIDAQR
jgi:ParB family transcriptional regulator, chromosome partitioning protein